jgi:thermostable 8-oxoguanine DNA glycosylase
VCAAGKNGVTSARCLNSLLTPLYDKYKEESPFELLRCLDCYGNLPEEMKKAGLGCYNNKAKTFRGLIYTDIDLKVCSVDELEDIIGIGPKTSRCFILHSRPNQQVACLDTHILKWLRDQGVDAPKSTPSYKKYLMLEKKFIELAANRDLAALDLEIWNRYRSA